MRATKIKTSPKLADIAAIAGVSIPTVAKALHGTGGANTRVSKETTLKIKSIAKKLGYRPNLIARQLAGKRSQTVGVIIDSYAPQVAFDTLAEMEKQAAKLNYRFMVGQAHNDLDRILKYIQDFNSRGIDGLICVSHNYPDIADRIDQAITNTSLKVVFVGKPINHPYNFNFVDVDIASGVEQIVDYLVSRNKRKIGLIIPKSKYSKILERKEGYLNGLRKHNLKVDKNLIKEIPGEVAYQVDIPTLKFLVMDLVERNIDGIICSNDRIAVRVMKILKSEGVMIPEQVGIVGIDNLEICEFVEPELTSLDQNRPELAKIAVNILIDQIENNLRRLQQVIIKPKLVIRNST